MVALSIINSVYIFEGVVKVWLRQGLVYTTWSDKLSEGSGQVASSEHRGQVLAVMVLACMTTRS